MQNLHAIKDGVLWPLVEARGKQSAAKAAPAPQPLRRPARSDDDRRDAELLGQSAGGDREALGELFDRHAEIALGLAKRILGNRQDAEDLVHDVFLEAWRKAASYDPRRASVRGWLLVRLRSRAIDRLRSLQVARRFAMADAAEPDPPPPAATNPEATSDAGRARLALGTLNPEQRSVVELAYFQGLTLREVAEQQSIPLGTVKSRLAAALAALRLRLGAEPGLGADPEEAAGLAGSAT